MLTGGEADGLVFPPTVLRGVTPEMRVYGEESFGPSASVIDVDGAEEAMHVANDTEYGLSVVDLPRDVAAERASATDSERDLPHQRCNRSGRAAGAVRRGQGQRLGLFGGRAALEEFTELRWITVQELPRAVSISRSPPMAELLSLRGVGLATVVRDGDSVRVEGFDASDPIAAGTSCCGRDAAIWS